VDLARRNHTNLTEENVPMNIFEQMDIALAESYREGFTAGVKSTCEELVKTFEEIPTWGSAAAEKVNQLLNLYKLINKVDDTGEKPGSN
jgi:hypothetical protein